MTEKLRTLLHERATDVDFPTLDLDALVRAGDRRRRRRGGIVVAGGVAALAVTAALVGPLLVDAGDEGDGSGPATGTSSTTSLPTGVFSWASGSVIHAGDAQVDVGAEVAAFVANDAGYVFADTDGLVHELVDGQLSEIGRTDRGSVRLVTDHDSSLVGWVSTEGDAPAFVVHDLATGARVLEDDSATAAGMGGLADEEDPAYFYALDGHTAYWRDHRGAVAVDLRTGGVEVVDGDAANGFDLVDVQDGVLVLSGDEGIEVGTSVEDARPLGNIMEGSGRLSPSATRYAPDAETLTVVGVGDGADVSPRLEGYYFSTAYEWVDDDTVHVIAQEDEESALDLLACTVPAGTCELLVDGAPDGLQLPVGWALGG
jgi:hypothetical protein